VRAVHRPLRLAVLVAVSAVGLAVLPAPPAVAEEEPAGTVVGQLVQGYADPGPADDGGADPGHEDAGLLSWIQTAPGETVRVPTEDLPEADPGATVEVALGDPVEDEAAEQGLEAAQEVLAAEVLEAAPEAPTAAAGLPVDHPVRVVMLQPADAAAQRTADRTTLAEVVAAVDGPVAAYWSEQTGGAHRFGVVAAVDWVVSTATCADPFGLWADAAAAAGWTPGSGSHLLAYLPENSPGCAYGLGTVSRSTADGGLAYVQDTRTSVIAHEFGHNLSLGHASALQCDRAPEAGRCRTTSYADYYDVMGFSWARLGSLSAPHAARLRALPVADAGEQGGSYALPRWDTRPAGQAPWALRLTDAEGVRYWLEYRGAGGQDAWLAPGPTNPLQLDSGVLLRREQPGADDDTLLVDGTPSAASRWDADAQVALPLGIPVPVSGGDVVVTVRSVTGTSATVEVGSGGPAAMAAAAAALGSALGSATSALTCDETGARGCSRSYTGGTLYWSAATGAHLVRDALLAQYTRAGAARGWLGYPLAERYATAGGGSTQAFQSGRIHWSPATGAYAVPASIGAAYDPLWGESGVLGYPVADPYPTANGGQTQAFQRGRIHWSTATGAHAVYGEISRVYDPLWGESGVLGYPVTERYPTAGGGYTQAFQNGRIHWSAATGPHAVHGEISRVYDPLWGESGVLGYPVTERYPTAAGGWTQAFQNGRIHWSPASGGHAVLSMFGRAYDPLWGESGPLGYPLGARYPTAQGGWTQPFQHGRIHWSPATGAHAVHGDASRVYDPLWGESGVLGYPLTERYPTAAGGWTQAFQNGRIHWSPATGGFAVIGAISRAYDSVGGESGRLGYPVSPRSAPDGTAFQRFQYGSIGPDGRGQLRVTYLR
jgi:uncharacterized protein with LGFP repeats